MGLGGLPLGLSTISEVHGAESLWIQRCRGVGKALKPVGKLVGLFQILKTLFGILTMDSRT